MANLHMIKMAPGVREIETLEAWVLRSRRINQVRGPGDVVTLTTRSFPSRAADLLDGGSLYWVFAGAIRARQQLLGLDRGLDGNGKSQCRMTLSPDLLRTHELPRKAFRGWRYVAPDQVPDDLSSPGSDMANLPEDMQRELRALGIL